MDTIILFGASRGGMNFIENHHQQYHITAIVDNDVKKQGRLLNHVPIIAINQISAYTYDYIIVTSMYVHSVTAQLEGLNIPKSKIKYASKKSMKVIADPFRNKDILNCANQMIITLSNILKDIRHYYTFGTLLGIVRDGGLIPWDDDIDIAVFVEDVLEIKELLLLNGRKIDAVMETKMYLRYYPSGDIASLSIDCYHSDQIVFNINMDCIYDDGEIAKQELNITPSLYFEKVEKYEFNQCLINVPSCYEEYLEYTYGDWKVVKENTSFNDNTLSFVEPKESCSSEIFYGEV